MNLIRFEHIFLKRPRNHTLHKFNKVEFGQNLYRHKG